jgi:hypothetical protein
MRRATLFVSWVVNEFSYTPEYSLLTGYLSPELRDWLEMHTDKRIREVDRIGADAWRREVQDKRRQLLYEVARLEKEWGLV